MIFSGEWFIMIYLFLWGPKDCKKISLDIRGPQKLDIIGDHL